MATRRIDLQGKSYAEASRVARRRAHDLERRVVVLDARLVLLREGLDAPYANPYQLGRVRSVFFATTRARRLRAVRDRVFSAFCEARRVAGLLEDAAEFTSGRPCSALSELEHAIKNARRAGTLPGVASALDHVEEAARAALREARAGRRVGKGDLNGRPFDPDSEGDGEPNGRADS
jgi:hypothetical protein